MHKADQHTTSRSTEESMEYAYLGIDIAKRKFDVALRLPDGRVRVKAFANDAAGHAALRGWITRYHAGPVHACLEATGTYGDGLAETLADAGLVVSVVNPAIIEAYARCCLTRTKTDPTDARLIAQFCATQQPRPWVPLPPEVRALQALVRRLDALEGMRTQERNRLAAEPAGRGARLHHACDRTPRSGDAGGAAGASARMSISTRTCASNATS